MSCGDEVKRMIVKRSLTAGQIPTVPPNEDHRSGLWSATDIYKGELFFNVPDGKMYTRSDNGIETVSTTSGEGTILYKARLVQSGTSAPTITEYINNTGETITAIRSVVGVYQLQGFNTVLTGSLEITMSNGQSGGGSVLFNRIDTSNVRFNTYDSSGTISDGILLGNTGGTNEVYNVVTIKQY